MLRMLTALCKRSKILPKKFTSTSNEWLVNIYFKNNKTDNKCKYLRVLNVFKNISPTIQSHSLDNASLTTNNEFSLAESNTGELCHHQDF